MHHTLMVPLGLYGCETNGCACAAGEVTPHKQSIKSSGLRDYEDAEIPEEGLSGLLHILITIRLLKSSAICPMIALSTSNFKVHHAGIDPSLSVTLKR